MSKKLKIRKFSDRERCSISSTADSKTEQHHRDACDINLMVKRAGATGQFPGATGQPMYFDAPAISYHQALEIVREADAAFDGLPGATRKEFGNDPYALLTAIELAEHDEDVKAKLERLEILPAPVAAPDTGPESPAPPGNEPGPANDPGNGQPAPKEVSSE